MYLMNPDLTFGRERMKDRLHRAEMMRLARQARQPAEIAAPAAVVATTVMVTLGPAVECGEPCEQTAAA